MLSFLRKIRRSLIASGSARRYVLYAIGEIGLVVIGILIALQINTWNEQRKERSKETEILNAIADNLTINLEALRSDIETLRSYDMSSRIILRTLDKKEVYHDSLDVHFHRSRIPKDELYLSQLGYEQYKDAGFGLIRNKGLKQEVLNFFESTYPTFFSGYHAVNEYYVPFIDYHVPLFIYKGQELKPIDFLSLYDDAYFKGWIRAYMEGRHTLVDMETALSVETTRVLGLVQEELQGANQSH